VCFWKTKKEKMTSFFNEKTLGISGALLGATGVSLGALGAHALSDRFTTEHKAKSFATAVQYQLLHAVAMLATCKDPKMRQANIAWLMGSCIFSGSIYCLSLDIGPKKILGPITPLGGVMMIVGWCSAAAAKF
jgi:uncharacterized membrane protein YgdD (TMEM256/DUF423 family)